jgi:hypothetical protein
MIRRRIVFGLILAAVVATQPGHGAARETVQGVAFLLQDASCSQTAYILTYCPCSPPIISAYALSTKLDLSQYSGKFISYHGFVVPGSCQVPVLDLRKVEVQPAPPPCPCEA